MRKVVIKLGAFNDPEAVDLVSYSVNNDNHLPQFGNNITILGKSYTLSTIIQTTNNEGNEVDVYVREAI